MTSKQKKELIIHLEAVFQELEKLIIPYRQLTQQLLQNTLSNFTITTVEQWFQTYLRLIDLGIQIRRGEIRHLTATSMQYPCMHTTGSKNALHSGLSIDDGNAIFNKLEALGMPSSKLDKYFFRMDAIDGEEVESCDVLLADALSKLLRMESCHYKRIEMNGNDPHQQLLIYHATTYPQTVTKITRTCFQPQNCKCGVDDTSWMNFQFQSTDRKVKPTSGIKDSMSQNTPMVDDMDVEVSVIDIQKQYGFDFETAAERNNDTSKYKTYMRSNVIRMNGKPQGKIEPTKQKLPVGVYISQVQNRGEQPSNAILHLLRSVGTNNTMILHFSPPGLNICDALLSPTVNELQDLLDVIRLSNIIITELYISNCYLHTSTYAILIELLKYMDTSGRLKKLEAKCLSLPLAYERVPTLSHFLRHLPFTLCYLDLSYNVFTIENRNELIQFLLSKTSPLDCILLKSCFIGSGSLKTTAENDEADRILANFLSSKGHFVDLSENTLNTNFIQSIMNSDARVMKILKLEDIAGLEVSQDQLDDAHAAIPFLLLNYLEDLSFSHQGRSMIQYELMNALIHRMNGIHENAMTDEDAALVLHKLQISIDTTYNNVIPSLVSAIATYGKLNKLRLFCPRINFTDIETAWSQNLQTLEVINLSCIFCQDWRNLSTMLNQLRSVTLQQFTLDIYVAKNYDESNTNEAEDINVFLDALSGFLQEHPGLKTFALSLSHNGPDISDRITSSHAWASVIQKFNEPQSNITSKNPRQSPHLSKTRHFDICKRNVQRSNFHDFENTEGTDNRERSGCVIYIHSK